MIKVPPRNSKEMALLLVFLWYKRMKKSFRQEVRYMAEVTKSKLH